MGGKKPTDWSIVCVESPSLVCVCVCVDRLMDPGPVIINKLWDPDERKKKEKMMDGPPPISLFFLANGIVKKEMAKIF